MGVPRYLSYKYLGRYVHPSLTLICRQQAKSLFFRQTSGFPALRHFILLIPQLLKHRRMQVLYLSFHQKSKDTDEHCLTIAIVHLKERLTK